MSSAYINLRLRVTGRSFVYRLNNVGARKEPWGNPFTLDSIQGEFHSNPFNLGLITINNISTITSEASRDPIVDKYRDVFNGIGCFSGEYHMVMDPEVKPVQHQPRRAPIPISGGATPGPGRA